MAKVVLRKTLNGRLEPADEIAAEELGGIKVGDLVLAEIRRPRNIGWHRKLFALLTLIKENQTRYPTTDALLDVIKVYTGHCIVLRDAMGRDIYVPKSIAFHNMDQAQFEAWWSEVVKLVCEKIVPGMKREELEREIMDLVA